MQLSLICFTLTFLLIVPVFSEPVTESGISSNYVFDSPFEKNSQNRFDVNKPSKLRLYLLADLARAADMKTFISNCDSAVELKITSKNCTCSNYSCQRYYKTIKKARILDRNCEDICCGKRLRGKSLDTINDKKLSADVSEIVRCGEIIPDENNKLVVPWIVHVLTKGQEICLGSILSSRAVITSSNCVENENTTIVKTSANNTEAATFKIKEVLTSSVIKDSAILVLNKPFTGIDMKRSPCIPKDTPKSNFSSCYIGLSNAHAIKVNVLASTDCPQSSPGGMSNSFLCAKMENIFSQQIIPGAPLFCALDASFPNSFQIVGTFLRKNSDIFIFDNLNQIKSMITKYLYNLM